MAAMFATKAKKDTAPSYRRRKGLHGRVRHALTKKRKDYWLGELETAIDAFHICNALFAASFTSKRFPLITNLQSAAAHAL